MGIQERKEREKEQRKQDIIEAAERIFFTKGFEDSTMDDIAEEAELSKGTLYLYFKSKEQLYLEIMLRGEQIMNSLFKKASEKVDTGLEKSYAIGRAYQEFRKNHYDYFNAMIYFNIKEDNLDEEDLVAMKLHKERNDGLNMLIASLQCGVDDGSVHPEIDPVKTSVLLWGMANGLFQLLTRKTLILEKVHNIDTKEVAEYFYEFILHALSNKENK